MKPVLVLYATREGHTRAVAQHLATCLELRGLTTETVNAMDIGEPFSLAPYGAVLLAASVHAGNHEREMIAFAKRHASELMLLPNALFSVSLTEATVENPERSGAERNEARGAVQQLIEKFCADTGFQPRHVTPVAGALMYTQYGSFTKLIMRWIAKRAGGSTDTTQDHEYTDWAALDAFAEEFARSLFAGALPASNAHRATPSD